MPKVSVVDLTTSVLVESIALDEHDDVTFDEMNRGRHDERPLESLMEPIIREDSPAIRDNPHGQIPGQYGTRPRCIKVSKYIQVPENHEQPFTVVVFFGVDYPWKHHDILVQVDCDGKFAHSLIMKRSTLQKMKRGRTEKIKGRLAKNEEGIAQLYPFMFSKLQICEYLHISLPKN